MEQNDLLQQLKSRFSRLSKGQKQIASYIMRNYDRAAYITAARMGQLVGVSESTVVRFAYAVGFDGYPALQRALQELIRNRLTAVQRIELSAEIDESDVLKTVLKADMQNIRETIDNIDDVAFQGAIGALLSAKRIYIIGMRSAYPLAQFLSYYLNFICKSVISVHGALNDAWDQIAHIGQGDLCIAISFPRYSVSTVETLQYAKELNATTIAITDSNASPLARYADYTLIARSDMASFADSLVAPLSLINAIIVSAGLKKKDEIREHLDRLERIWERRHVYVESESTD